MKREIQKNHVGKAQRIVPAVSLVLAMLAFCCALWLVLRVLGFSFLPDILNFFAFLRP